MSQPDKLYRILMDNKAYDTDQARALRRVIGYTIGETVVLPEEPEGENMESIKADLEEQAKRVMDNQIKDLMQLKYDF